MIGELLYAAHRARRAIIVGLPAIAAVLATATFAHHRHLF